MSIINTFINSKNYSIILTIRDIYVVVRHTVSLTYSSLIQRFAYSTSSNTCNIFWLFCQFHTNAVPQGRRSVLTATYHANIKSGLRGYVTEPPLHLFPDHVDSEIIFDIFCDIHLGSACPDCPLKIRLVCLWNTRGLFMRFCQFFHKNSCFYYQ